MYFVKPYWQSKEAPTESPTMSTCTETTTVSLRPSLNLEGIPKVDPVRTKTLLGYVRFARLNLPFFHMHPNRRIDPHAELSLDLDESVFWSQSLRAQAFDLLDRVRQEYPHDPRWELHLVQRTLTLAKADGFTEVAFYEAYAQHILTSTTSVYANAQQVVRLFRDGSMYPTKDYGRR